MMSIEIVEVHNKKQVTSFIQFPNQLYKANKYYIPSLQVSVEWMLSPKNPFLKHSQITLFLALKNGNIVGRIASIFNKTHLDRYFDSTGFFGFFDSVNNYDVAQALFNSAFDWLKSKGLTRMLGPTNLTTNDSCGFLVDGFNQSPMVLMPYNYDYYNDLCIRYGMVKEIDLFSYQIDGSSVINKYENVTTWATQNLLNSGIKIRPLSKRFFEKDIASLRVVYNKCNESNWGFNPLNSEEFMEMAKDLIRVTSYDLVIMAEKDDRIIGFIVAIPNINQSLKYVKNGKLFPIGIIKLLWYKRKINSARILILGLLKEFSGRGIDLLMYKHIKQALNNHNIFTSEACYVMESNSQMNSILNKIDGRQLKKYRIYGITSNSI